MYKHTFYYFLGNKKYPEIYILPLESQMMQSSSPLESQMMQFSFKIAVVVTFITFSFLN